MKSIIICEGPTDSVLMQYYMRTVNGWNEGQESKNKPKEFEKSWSRDFQKNGNTLRIICAGGCSRMPLLLSKILDNNCLAAAESEVYSKIVYLTDNDEEQTKEDVFSSLKETCNTVTDFANNAWSSIKFENDRINEVEVKLLPLVIPFSEQGAIETFLLEAIRDGDEYDASVINRGNKLVDDIASDSDKKYLKHRRDITKAKFNVFFSIAAPAEQFTQRQDILKNINWEQYETIRKCFAELRKL